MSGPESKHDATGRLPGPASGPTLVVSRCRAGAIGETVRTPQASATIRYFMGACRVAEFDGSAWRCAGEAAAGFYHVSGPGKTVRTEWLHDGEEVIVTVPHAYWGERVTARMRGALERGTPRRHGDDAVDQLVRLVLRAADQSDTAMANALVPPILERALVWGERGTAASPAKRHAHALPPHRMAKVAAYVRDNLDGPITLAAMAAAAGMSPMHFAATFRVATGKRPHHYLIEERIRRAKALMRGTRHTLTEIAMATGFNTQAHFTTVFKRFTGATPSAWRFSAMAAVA
jgi:AraC-like DNA-binding protein